MRTAVNALVAVRTHVWDENIEKSVLRSLPMYAGIDFVILADESNATINTDFEKVSHTEDFSSFPLPNVPAHERLWYNADYPLYVLRRIKPGYEWYVVVEYDVVVAASVLHMLEEVQRREIDFVAHSICEAKGERDWAWFHTCVNFSDAPWIAYFPFMVISGRAIDHLLRVRYEFYDKININKNKNIALPFCELFIPTALCSLSQYKYAELSEFVDLVHYSYCQPVDLEDPVCRIVHTIVHPVLMEERLIRRIIRDFGIASLFDGKSTAMHRLRFTDPRLLDYVVRIYLAEALQSARKITGNADYKVLVR